MISATVGPERRALSVTAIVGPSLVVAVLAVWRAIALPLWRDEFASSSFAALDPDSFGRAIGRVDLVLAPYYLLMRPLSGDPALLRIPSVVAGVLAVGLTAALAARWWGAGPGLASGLVLATNPLFIDMAATARPYALATLCVVAATVLLDRGAGSARMGWWFGFTATIAAAGFLQAFSLLIAPAWILLIVGRGRRTAIRAGAAFSVAVVFVGVFAFVASRQRAQIGWIQLPDIKRALGTLANVVVYQTEGAVSPLGLLAISVVGIGIAAGLVCGVIGWRRKGVTRGLAQHAFALLALLLPWAALLVASHVFFPMLRTAYLTPSTFAASLLVGAGISAFGALIPKALRATTCVVVVVIASAQLAIVAVAASQGWWQEDLPGLVDRLQAKAVAGDTILLIQNYNEGGLDAGFAYYAGDRDLSRITLDNLADGGQPIVQARRVIDDAPWATSRAGDTPPAGQVWVVATTTERSASELAAIRALGLQCDFRGTDDERWRFGQSLLLRVPCSEG